MTGFILLWPPHRSWCYALVSLQVELTSVSIYFLFLSLINWAGSRHLINSYLFVYLFFQTYSMHTQANILFSYSQIETYLHTGTYVAFYFWLLQKFSVICLCLFSWRYFNLYLFNFLKKSSSKDMVTDFREGEGKEREGDKHWWVASHMSPNWQLNPQPRHVPSLGIEPAIFWFIGQCSNQLSCTSQSLIYIYVILFVYLFLYGVQAFSLG